MHTTRIIRCEKSPMHKICLPASKLVSVNRCPVDRILTVCVCVCVCVYKHSIKEIAGCIYTFQWPLVTEIFMESILVWYATNTFVGFSCTSWI